MSQVCFSCGYGLPGLTPKLMPPAAGAGDVLGVCWECGVLGCYEHAQRDATSGKWRCFSSIATALFDSSQRDAPGASPRSGGDQLFADSADFEARLPELAHASARLRIRDDPLPPILERAGRQVDYRARQLLADSLGVAEFIVHGTEESRPRYLTTARPYEQAPASEDVARAVLIPVLAEAVEGMIA
jgi:hypothetical protein